ncbi:MAG: hypothetical protein ACC618_03505 [Patescibacteria group bacterium]
MSEEPGVEKQESPQELESLRSEIREYYKGAEVGTPKFMALADEIQLNEDSEDFEDEKRRLVEIKSEGTDPKKIVLTESSFQLAVSKLTGIEQTISQRESEVTGYQAEKAKAYDFLNRLIELNEPSGKLPGDKISQQAKNNALSFFIEIRGAKYS